MGEPRHRPRGARAAAARARRRRADAGRSRRHVGPGVHPGGAAVARGRSGRRGAVRRRTRPAACGRCAGLACDRAVRRRAHRVRAACRRARCDGTARRRTCAGRACRGRRHRGAGDQPAGHRHLARPRRSGRRGRAARRRARPLPRARPGARSRPAALRTHALSDGARPLGGRVGAGVPLRAGMRRGGRSATAPEGDQPAGRAARRDARLARCRGGVPALRRARLAKPQPLLARLRAVEPRAQPGAAARPGARGAADGVQRALLADALRSARSARPALCAPGPRARRAPARRGRDRHALARGRRARSRAGAGPRAGRAGVASTVRRLQGGERMAQTSGRVLAPMAATVVEIAVSAGEQVDAGQTLVVLEAMKMEHELRADAAMRVIAVAARVGETVEEGDLLVELAPSDRAAAPVHVATDPAPERSLRADLAELIARHAWTLDAERPEAVARRHALGLRTARENIADLCDAGSFVEYGALAVAAQRSRRSADDLMRNTPADGMVTGIGGVNGAAFGPDRARCVVMAYDATVLAGTQGMRNHQKTDRMLGIALAQRLPVVLFAEGGGGRPGDVDAAVLAGLHVPTFASHARLSGQVPLVGIAAGRCFAGNAALLGCCDVIIATAGSNIGMGGPAMVEGGGLGVFKPEQIGPSAEQARNGVIDVLVADEAEAVAAARRYLSYFQGRTAAWEAPDALTLRDALPENRLRSYAMRDVLAGVCDRASLLELRAGFGVGVLTALARIEGRPVGVIASNPLHLGGAIDADAADKAARFMQLCDVHGLPIVSFVDTPGFMVGPDAEAQAQVRHVSRMFVVGARLRVPLFAVVVRKGYGLGAMAMTGGGFHAPVATVAWPSGEFGAMGLEGAVRLGYRRELEAVSAGAERDALFRRLLDEQYANGKAVEMAATLEIDAVIDPAETRRWLVQGLASARIAEPGVRYVDPW
ncbi:MAG: hypothetical protein JSR59_06960 [Proteobacteria bacterium]|nr:hypothetical protein [Pseudomonadota bacterium]